MAASKVGSQRPDSTIVSHANSGPWGKLEYVRIAIELPDHYIHLDTPDTNSWFFRGFSREDALGFLRECELSGKQLHKIEISDWQELPDGAAVVVPDDLVWSLTRESRSKIYNLLANYEENVDHYNAFAYRSDRLDERLLYSGLSAASIEMFRDLLYSQESLVRFADVDLVLRKLSDPQEQMRFVKTVARRSSLLMKLHVSPETDVNALVEYWGGGGRSKDLRPLLESLARVPGGTKIDIAHLLPPFVRKRLYSYPSPEREAEVGQMDCHWTSLNFWNDPPSPPFNSPEEITHVIESEYGHVADDLADAQLGDIIFLQNQDGLLVHSAVFIADDVVFTKNGSGANQPWIYMKMEDMLPYYQVPNDKLRIVVFRRKVF